KAPGCFPGISHAKVLKNIKIASRQGVAQAQYKLGRFYENGAFGLEKNRGESRRLYGLAAACGHLKAKRAFARLRQFQENRKWILPALESAELAYRPLEIAGRLGRGVEIFRNGYLSYNGCAEKPEVMVAFCGTRTESKLGDFVADLSVDLSYLQSDLTILGM